MPFQNQQEIHPCCSSVWWGNFFSLSSFFHQDFVGKIDGIGENITKLYTAVNHLRAPFTWHNFTTSCFSPFFFFQIPAMQIEFLANYVAELSLLEYNFLCYAPSLIAASAIFLANFILQPTKRPWVRACSSFYDHFLFRIHFFIK